MERARKAGRGRPDRHAGLVVLQRPGLGQPIIPEKMDLRAMLRFAPEGRHAPALAARSSPRPGARPDRAQHGPAGQAAPTFFAAYGEWMQSPLPTWDDVAWMREQWGGPFMLKGVAGSTTPGEPSTLASPRSPSPTTAATTSTAPRRHIRVLPAIAEAVGDQVEVLLDGGIRRGGDVVKALALGARAVMIGRAYLWGLAATARPGVENVLDILRGGIDSALLGLGHSSIHELTKEDLLIPSGFSRRLGG